MCVYVCVCVDMYVLLYVYIWAKYQYVPIYDYFIDDVSNLRFWNAINGEAWFINATQYGHGDLLIEFLSDDVIGVKFKAITARNSY